MAGALRMKRANTESVQNSSHQLQRNVKQRKQAEAMPAVQASAPSSTPAVGVPEGCVVGLPCKSIPKPIPGPVIGLPTFPFAIPPSSKSSTFPFSVMPFPAMMMQQAQAMTAMMMSSGCMLPSMNPMAMMGMSPMMFMGQGGAVRTSCATNNTSGCSAMNAFGPASDSSVLSRQASGSLMPCQTAFNAATGVRRCNLAALDSDRKPACDDAEYRTAGLTDGLFGDVYNSNLSNFDNSVAAYFADIKQEEGSPLDSSTRSDSSDSSSETQNTDAHGVADQDFASFIDSFLISSNNNNAAPAGTVDPALDLSLDFGELLDVGKPLPAGPLGLALSHDALMDALAMTC